MGGYEVIRREEHVAIYRARDESREMLERQGFGFEGRYAGPDAFRRALEHVNKEVQHVKAGKYEWVINVAEESGRPLAEVYVRRAEK